MNHINRANKRLYWIYHDAKRRCINPKHTKYKDYGGRGIEFRFNSFEEWLNYIGPRPDNFEQDRLDNNGHYEVGNVKWVSIPEQQKNKRIYKNNTSGIKGVNFVTSLRKWIARCNNNGNGKRDYLYAGKDFFEACCTRKSWENLQGT